MAYTNNYNFVSASTNASAISWNEISSASNPVTEYCLENTQEKEYNNHAYTTQVLLQANFAPKKLKKLDGGTVDVGEGESWMIVNGVSYTYDTLMDWIENELTKKYKDGNPVRLSNLYINSLQPVCKIRGFLQGGYYSNRR